MKCVLCQQEMQGGTPKWKCINNKCPDYFEPAAAHPSLFSKKMKTRESLAADILIRAFKPGGGPDGTTLLSMSHPGSELPGDPPDVVLRESSLEGVPSPRVKRPCGYRMGNDVCGREQEYTGDLWACPVHNADLFKTAPGPGIKLDTGKPLVYTEFLMQFPRAIRLVALVGEAGSKAPGHIRSGWKTVDQGFHRYSDALGRHMLDEAILATSDEPPSEDPLHDMLWEAATSAWNSMARLEHLIRENAAAAQRLDPTARP